jgi:hypothetical protein
MFPAKLIHGDYKRNIGVWEKHFSSDRILCLFFDDIVQSPQEVLNKVFSFLGVPPIRLPSSYIERKINTAADFEMPGPINAALTDHYADQFSFIKKKFDRELVY